ncbi:hypothetical protein, partial [uncultured Bosea sp.]|uniref:hypothetical protein n=1 Tax=uncultured Bosea sp. TaxID=211457 RepID=UPI0025ED3669
PRNQYYQKPVARAAGFCVWGSAIRLCATGSFPTHTVGFRFSNRFHKSDGKHTLLSRTDAGEGFIQS